MFDILQVRRIWLGCLVLAVAGSTGCMCTWEDVTSKEFKVSQVWSAPPPPMVVLEKSTDGYARAKAFTRLDEAKNDQGLHEKQMQMLQQAALADRDPLVRMAAIRTLGKYTDPRAPKILSDVYYSDPPKVSAEYKALIRQQALIALESTSPGEARQIFVKAAKQPAGELTATASRDRMEILDERLAAIRGLGKYNSPDSIETLVGLLEKEKDVAVRTCAAESLKSITKKDIPADGKMWREYVATGKAPPPQNNSMLAVFSRSETPNPVQAIGNWVKPSPPQQGVTTSMPNSSFSQPNAQPTMLPQTIPTSPSIPQPVPQPTNINQVQFAPTGPITAPQAQTLPPPSFPVASPPITYGAMPATPQNAGTPPPGSYRNQSGDLVVPVGSPVNGMPGPSR